MSLRERYNPVLRPKIWLGKLSVGSIPTPGTNESLYFMRSAARSESAIENGEPIAQNVRSRGGGISAPPLIQDHDSGNGSGKRSTPRSRKVMHR
jgi:hypothetical protein